MRGKGRRLLLTKDSVRRLTRHELEGVAGGLISQNRAGCGAGVGASALTDNTESLTSDVGRRLNITTKIVEMGTTLFPSTNGLEGSSFDGSGSR